MKSNLQLVQDAIDIIEENLSERFNIDEFSNEKGYSKYHFHKIFTNIVGIPPHQYLIQRKLTEAAKQMISSNRSIIDIAISAGYESQQAFSDAFRRIYKISPGKLRKKIKRVIFTKSFDVNSYMTSLSPKDLYQLSIETKGEIRLVGYRSDTLRGFFVIPRLWGLLHKVKDTIKSRISNDRVFALNDYSDFDNKSCTDRINFNYMACIEVDNSTKLPKNMVSITLPGSNYAIFRFRAKPEDSIEETLLYIYKEWFPSNSYQLNDKVRYELIEYGEERDHNGFAEISVCIPIL